MEQDYKIKEVRVLCDGDVYILTPENKEDSVEIAFEIYKNLGGDFRTSNKQYLIDGEELRPSGAYAVRVRDNGEISVDNRNGRGYEPNRIQLKQSLERFLE